MFVIQLLKNKPEQLLPKSEKRNILHEVKGLAVHQFSSVAVHATDSIIIAAIPTLGIVLVGAVGNYNHDHNCNSRDCARRGKQCCSWFWKFGSTGIKAKV